MGKLIYTGILSLDGFIAGADGDFSWSAPTEEVHGFINDLQRPIGTYLYGRRMYEVMKVWESWPTGDEPAVVTDFAELWRTAEKIVYSRTLDAVDTAKTRLERNFDAAAVRQLKEESPRDISVSGPTLASHAIEVGLVDEFGVFLHPTLVGGGTRHFPLGVRQSLELVDEHRFENGVRYLSYRPTT